MEDKNIYITIMWILVISEGILLFQDIDSTFITILFLIITYIATIITIKFIKMKNVVIQRTMGMDDACIVFIGSKESCEEYVEKNKAQDLIDQIDRNIKYGTTDSIITYDYRILSEEEYEREEAENNRKYC